MRGACVADDPWQGYRQKFRVFFREAIKATRASPDGSFTRLLPPDSSGLGARTVCSPGALLSGHPRPEGSPARSASASAPEHGSAD
jgi:hypothetical protein